MATEDFLEFLPLYPDEDEPTIRDRWEAWANEGLGADDVDEWTDVREGSFFWVPTSPGVREAARIYDLIGQEVPMSAFALWSWSTYLDDLGLPYGLDRLPATPAAGTVRFTGPASLVPPGTRVSAEATDLETAAAEYVTTASGSIPASPGYVDLPVEAVEAGVAGNLPAGGVSLLLTPLTGVTVDNPDPFVGGTDAEDDEAYRARLLAQYAGGGGGNIADYERWARDYPGVGRATVIPIFNGPGTVLVIVTTAEGAQVSQATIDGLQQQLDPPGFQTTLTSGITLPTGTIPVVSTSGVRPATSGIIRIGNNLVSYAALTGTSFTGCTGGTGAVANGALVTQSGRGGGDAPVGHVVVVKTATTLPVTVTATVEPEDGYTLDGAGGTIAIRGEVVRSVTEYVESVQPGGEVVLTQVIGRLTTVTGVHDVKLVQINGSAANLAISGDPTPRVPDATVTLTEGTVP